MRQDLQKLLAERDGQLEKRDGTDDQLRVDLELSQREGAARTEALARAEAQLAAMTEETQEQAERLAQAQSTAETNRATVAELQEQLARMGAECDQEVAARKAAKEEAARALELLASEKAERASLVELLQEAGVAAGRVAAEHAAMRDELVSVQAENASLKTKVDSLDLMVDSMNSMGLGQEVGEAEARGGDGGQGGADDDGGSLGAELERDAEQDRVDVEEKMLVLKSWVSALVMERDDLLVETRRLRELQQANIQPAGYRPPTSGAQAGAQWGAV
jgi:membrane protein involved in colicin uptake|eukprot:COSAG06_NODE_382_length_16566_cov_8.629137_18_plen_277_part_00